MTILSLIFLFFKIFANIQSFENKIGPNDPIKSSENLPNSQEGLSSELSGESVDDLAIKDNQNQENLKYSDHN